MKRCVLCGHAVGLGDRHAARSCPPKMTGRRFDVRRRAKRRGRKAGTWVPKRGEAVAGTGVPKGGASK